MTFTDRTLLERWITSRDAEAFNELISRHARLVYGVCKRLLRNDADAEDAAQDCFLKLARAASPPQSSVLGWLHAVATRNAIDVLRTRKRRELRERAFAEACAENRVRKRALEEVQEHVDECIAQLPEELRVVIVTHFLERRMQEEVASALGVSRQTVSHRIQKGIERLRFLLKQRGVIVSGAVLAASLAESSLEAAPAALLASLGRLALAGPSAVTAPTGTVLVLAKVGGFIMAKKLLLSGIVAAALFLFAGFLVFRSGMSPARRPLSDLGAIPAPEAAAPARKGSGPVEPRDARELGAPAGDAGAAVLSRRWIAGRVLDAEGLPAGGAKVVALVPAEKLEILAEAETDDAGGFRLELEPRDGVAVYAFKSTAGLGAATGELSELELVLEPLGEVGGRFYDRDTGASIPGLRVELAATPLSTPDPSGETARFHAAARKVFPELHGEHGAAFTDEEGSYLFQGVLPLRYRFQFVPSSSEYVLPGFRREDSLPDVTVGPGERKLDFDFALQRGGSIAGKVFGPDSKPVPGARVRALALHPMPFELACDPEGAYHFIGLAPNATYVISAAHDGLPPGESPTVAMPAAELVEGVDVHLVRGHALRGRFVDDLGKSIPGMRVYLSKLSDSDRRSSDYGEAVTGDDGAFHYDSVGPGKHAVWPTSTLHVTDEVLSFTMPEDRGIDDLELVLRRRASGFIAGRVVDHEGRPVAGFPVSAIVGLKTVSRAASGEDGAFRLEGLGDAEAYTVAAYSSEHWSARHVNVPVYSTGLTIVAIPRGRIAGRVVDASTQKPLEHFEVRAVFIRVEPGREENRFHLKWASFDSQAGEFQFERAEPVDCEIQARAEGYVEGKSSRFTIPPGGNAEGIVIALSRGASLRGIVLDVETGEPVAGALVRAHQHEAFFPGLLQESTPSYAPRGVWKLAMSGADGKFAFDGLALAETIHLAVWKDGYGPAVQTGAEVHPNAGALSITIARAATIVLSPQFRPAAGQRYEIHTLHREAKPWRAAFQTVVEVSQPGTVEVPGVAAGAYRLAVYSVSQEKGGALRRLVGEVRLKVAPGERREVPLDVDGLAERFASISGNVVGRSDLAGARLQVISDADPEEIYAHGPTAPDPDGRFCFSGLPPGGYTILATWDGANPAAGVRLPVQVDGRKHPDVVISLK